MSRERAWLEQARVIFLTVVSAGLKRGEILGLRWKGVDLADPAGAVLRVRETFVRGAEDTPKSQAGARTIALGPKLAEESGSIAAGPPSQATTSECSAIRRRARRSTRTPSRRR